ncbi:DUF2285 domain-containing protein [Acetobacter conturbans]|uniref:DUF2285 domain-containing protein n=1 Tax=Acetobacter conturbans TaxID=1737472 RepID=A0ABX0K500_9PROT|nr:DUF2285 domain-containing protein [Acetobacter conturbans]NHN89418.1 DUF2285 domain-containing protein [Acetobacter conturbans]
MGSLSPEQGSGIVAFVLHDSDDCQHLQIRSPAARCRAAALIPLDGGEEIRIAELRRFLKRLTGTNVPRLPRKLSLSRYRAWQTADAICAYAGQTAGASQREIGRVLDPSVRSMNARQWDTSSQRSRVGRLLKMARRMTEGREYFSLLRPVRFRLKT